MRIPLTAFLLAASVALSSPLRADDSPSAEIPESRALAIESLSHDYPSLRALVVARGDVLSPSTTAETSLPKRDCRSTR